MGSQETGGAGPPKAARELFGRDVTSAERYVQRLAGGGIDRGLMGPRERERLWERHVLNSAAIAELVPTGSRVVDVGSGAGLPGIPLAIARPDLDVVLLESMARRVEWLNEVVTELGLPVTVFRGRAEATDVRAALSESGIVVARAVAPIGRLVEWCLPLVRPQGKLVAMKGESAEEELARDRQRIERAGGVDARVESCGSPVLDRSAMVIVVRRAAAGRSPSKRGGTGGPSPAKRYSGSRARRERGAREE